MDEHVMAAAEFELTPEDWEEVNAIHLFDSPLYAEQLKNTRILSVLVFATLAVLCLLLGFVSGAVLSVAAALIVPVLARPLQQKAQRQALKKLTDEGIAHGTFGKHRVEVREDGLFHATEAYESLFRWHAIDEVKEKHGNFLVYIGPNAFLPIPQTAFPDAASLRRFSEAFFERITHHRELRRLAEGAESDPTEDESGPEPAALPALEGGPSSGGSGESDRV